MGEGGDGIGAIRGQVRRDVIRFPPSGPKCADRPENAAGQTKTAAVRPAALEIMTPIQACTLSVLPTVVGVLAESPSVALPDDTGAEPKP